MEYSALKFCAISLSAPCMFASSILCSENVFIISINSRLLFHPLVVVCIFQAMVIGLLAISLWTLCHRGASLVKEMNPWVNKDWPDISASEGELKDLW